MPDDRAPQNADADPHPAVGPDAHRSVDDPLVLDRAVQVVEPVVEIGDVHPVGEERPGTDLDIDVAVHRVVAPENDLVADPQRSLVRTQPGVVADMPPPAEDDPPIAGSRNDLDPPAQEDHALGDHVRMQQPEPEQPPVANQVPRRPGPVAHDPSQTGWRQVTDLPRVASHELPCGRSPVTDTL